MKRKSLIRVFCDFAEDSLFCAFKWGKVVKMFLEWEGLQEFLGTNKKHTQKLFTALLAHWEAVDAS